MNEVLQRLTGEELLVLAVLNGGAVYEAIETELNRRAFAARKIFLASIRQWRTMSACLPRPG